MVQVLLREHGLGVIGAYIFGESPRIGETINVRQADESAYFVVIAVEHLVTDPAKPASLIASVKREVKS